MTIEKSHLPNLCALVIAWHHFSAAAFLSWTMQSYFDSTARFPPLGDDAEYSAYFEAYLPDEGDRRRFLDGRLQGCKPSYGHLCFGAFMTRGLARLVWTTNFDQLVERTCG